MVAASANASNNVDLVFEGGGVKGIGLLGAYAALEEHHFQPQNVAGTSAGAIIAALVAAGYSASEIHDVIFPLDFRQFEDKAWEDRLPVIEKSASIFLDQGIYEGKAFFEWMQGLLARKKVRTFRDLIWDRAETSPQFRFKLQVIASDVTAHRLLVLPRDADHLGIAPEDLEVAQAVRMSMSIPIFFEPVRWTNPQTNHVHTIVDGGMLSNFPVWLFDCGADDEPAWPTFGLLLVEPDPKIPIDQRLPAPEADHRHGIRALSGYVKAMAQTMMEAHDRMYVEEPQFARTIPIPTLGVGTTEFDLSNGRKQDLFDSGRTAAEEFLATWDFATYIQEFRKGRVPGRRRELAVQMHQPLHA